MKKIIVALTLCFLITNNAFAQARDASASYEVSFENGATIQYQGCGRCIGYLSTGAMSASIVVYEKTGLSYWTIVIEKNNNGTNDVRFEYVDRNPAVPENLRGRYMTVYDVSPYFDARILELRPGGRIAGKLHPVKLKSFGYNRDATFSGSFELKLQ